MLAYVRCSAQVAILSVEGISQLQASRVVMCVTTCGIPVPVPSPESKHKSSSDSGPLIGTGVVIGFLAISTGVVLIILLVVAL